MISECGSGDSESADQPSLLKRGPNSIERTYRFLKSLGLDDSVISGKPMPFGEYHGPLGINYRFLKSCGLDNGNMGFR